MKAAIAIDDWKLPIFDRHLSKAGHTYEMGPGVTEDTLLLTVESNDMAALEIVVRSANTEAAQTPKGGRNARNYPH
ncbi:MAG TPA: hypothetical protein DCS42_06925 [Nitrospiraceae bacterium]|nr:hypothetical protein [Candidatus Omnitrophota bacterium]HAS53869.1 hypothetical protein [Nitrospiraceae bacterium]